MWQGRAAREQLPARSVLALAAQGAWRGSSSPRSPCSFLSLEAFRGAANNSAPHACSLPLCPQPSP